MGKWRWPFLVALPVVVGGLLFWRGIGRLRYEGSAILAFSGDPGLVDQELKIFRSENVRKRIDLALVGPAGPLAFSRVPAHPLEVSINAQAAWPKAVVQVLAAAGKVCVEQSLAKQKADFRTEMDFFQKQHMELEARIAPLLQERKTLASGPRISISRSESATRIRALQARRQFLIERYPTHSDIALLGTQIKDFQSQARPRASGVSARRLDLDRRVNENKMRMVYFSRRLQELALAETALRPAWKPARAISKPSWPVRVERWPIFAGVLAGVFTLGFLMTLEKSKVRQAVSPNGLWKPEPAPEKAPIELLVLPPDAESPSDPLTAKAAAIYSKWIEVAKVLYTPAPEPPQGILDSVGPLLQESSEFLPAGHDVLARYLAHTVTPGDLPAHVARTVLMTLTGAAEAGASPEHSLAMALAALFHDLAVVPRPAAMQEQAGSEIGRLSASVLRRIPGMQPAILSMVEEILIGMDEFKLDTWQNVATSKNLEPLSKVLREIDRFEKVMQKQRARLDRQISHRKAV